MRISRLISAFNYTQISPEIINNPPRYLYHSSPTINESLILAEGLKPRSRYKFPYSYFQPRLYFSLEPLEMIKMTVNHKDDSSEEISIDSGRSIFKIDSADLDLVLFKDYFLPHLPSAYTLLPVPPDNLSLDFRN